MTTSRFFAALFCGLFACATAQAALKPSAKGAKPGEWTYDFEAAKTVAATKIDAPAKPAPKPKADDDDDELFEALFGALASASEEAKKQKPAPPPKTTPQRATLSVNPGTLEFDEEGGTKYLTVTSNAKWSLWKKNEELVVMGDDELSFVTLGTETGLKVVVDPNRFTKNLACRFYVSAPGVETVEIIVRQKAFTPMLRLTRTDITFKARGGEEFIGVTSNEKWGFAKGTTGNGWTAHKEDGGIRIICNRTFSRERGTDSFYLESASGVRVRVNLAQEGVPEHNCHNCHGIRAVSITHVYCGGTGQVRMFTPYGPSWQFCAGCGGTGKIVTPCFRCLQTGKCRDVGCDGE